MRLKELTTIAVVAIMAIEFTIQSFAAPEPTTLAAKHGNIEVQSSISGNYNSCEDVIVVVNGDTIQNSTDRLNAIVNTVGNNNRNRIIVNGDTIVDNSKVSDIGNNNIPSSINLDYGYMTTSMLDSLANLGDAEALCQLGERYVSGYRAPKNQELGLTLMHKAARKDNIRALKRLSILYAGEENVKKNPQRAFEVLSRLDELGELDPWNAYYLGVIYHKGKVVKKDLDKATYYMKIAASAKYSPYEGEARKWLAKHKDK